MPKNTGKRIQTTNSSAENAITVSHVSKSFRLPHNRQNTIKGALVNLIGGGDRTFEIQEVLKDVSFEIKKGEFFGIVGRNGSGKSTLLKMLAGTYKPTEGEIVVNGSLTPFIELGVGFNPELTGRENVYLNGALLGFNDREVEAMYDDIVTFAELERFMDQKLKNYSSGMQVRLAFSIAIRARSDILLLDEVLAVGDEAFQRKCYEYFEDLKRNGRTVILVTHDMSAVENFCNRALLLEKGVISKVGKANEIANEYRKLFMQPSDEEPQEEQAVEDAAKRWGDGPMKFKKVKAVVGSERVHATAEISTTEAFEGNLILAYTVKNRGGDSLFGGSVKWVGKLSPGKQSNINLSFAHILSNGTYYLDVSLRKNKSINYAEFWTECCKFIVKNKIDNALHILADTRLDDSKSS